MYDNELIDSLRKGNNMTLKAMEFIIKATVKQGIKGFSGIMDSAIYYYHPRLKTTIIRHAPQMPIQEKNLVSHWTTRTSFFRKVDLLVNHYIFFILLLKKA